MRMPVIAEDEQLANESLALEVEGVVTGALVRPGGRPGRLELRSERLPPPPRLLS